MSKNKIACIIPARFNSTRFPQKVITPILDKPLIQWTYEAAMQCDLFDSVHIAYDDKAIFNVASQFSSNLIRTSTNCPTGSARMIEAVGKAQIEADIFLVWQADEPLVTPTMIKALLSNQSEDIDIWTLKTPMHSFKDVINPNIVKVVTDANDKALYFSRSPIPYMNKDEMSAFATSSPLPYFQHVGLYAFRSNTLKHIKHYEECELERYERLEQLTFLYKGLYIHVATTSEKAIGIDVPSDVDHVSEALKDKLIKR